MLTNDKPMEADMKFFSTTNAAADRSSSALSTTIEDCIRWLRDPLSHPVLEAMSERELADLPLGQSRATDVGECEA
jgi:hypothetical protein